MSPNNILATASADRDEKSVVPSNRASSYVIENFFQPVSSNKPRLICRLGELGRHQWSMPDGSSILLDHFTETAGIKCCFFRLPAGTERSVRFDMQGNYQLETCSAGGWLARPLDAAQPSYWLPRMPVIRKLDKHGHILAESVNAISAFRISTREMTIELVQPAEMCLDGVIWQLPATEKNLTASLMRPYSLERQPYFFWGSKTVVKSPADLYLHLVHGQVYANDFVFPRHWKFWSEHDAHGLYVTLSGLELATGKPLYGLLKKQLLLSVIARQSADGCWRHGEWTDLMETHYRSHNGAMLTIASGLEDFGYTEARQSLSKAVAHTVEHADQTGLGLWFLHDSLEESAESMDEMLRQTGTRWIPSRALGKSPSNKLILNTHLDAIVALDRYRQLTGDEQFASQLASAREAVRNVLKLRPAESLYKFVYWVVWLTLLPKAKAQQMPLPLRIIKRFARMYLIPNLHRLKRIFPRLVMPGGLIERHLSALHFGTHYHAVNLMDLARYSRRFPNDGVDAFIQQAIEAGNKLLETWGESKTQRFATVVWADALYHLCTQSDSREYRKLLAEAMLRISDLGLGLPPSLLGSDNEVIQPSHRIACPSPIDIRLRVANLSRNNCAEFIVVNPTALELSLEWENMGNRNVTWTAPDGRKFLPETGQPKIPARGWLLGQEN